MALFGRKKPAELLAEAMKYTDLVNDWLRQPMQAASGLGVVDRVTTEYYTLAVCCYLAQEKISPAARDYLHEAVVRSSNYGKQYSKDLRKDCNTMAVLLNHMNTKEKEARRGRKNVLQAIVDAAFADFTKNERGDEVRRIVYNTVNLFAEEIETTDYKGMRIPVSAPSRPAAPSRPITQTQEPKTPPAPKADYTFYNKQTGEPIYLAKRGNPFVYEGVVYQAVTPHDGPHPVFMLDVARNTMCTDVALSEKLAHEFFRTNPAAADQLQKELEREAAAKTPAAPPAPDHPDVLTVRNGQGQTRQLKVLGWMDFGGKEYAITTDLSGNKSILVLVRGADGHLTGVDGKMARDIFAIYRDRHPSQFK